MRVRIRGPSGKSTTATLDDTATIDTLRKTIITETALSSFEVKFGYPPKTLALDQYPSDRLLSELDVKLNGEQLIVNNSEAASASKSSLHPSPNTETKQTPTSRQAGPSNDAASSNLYSKSPSKEQKSSSAAAPLSLARKQNATMEDDPPEIILPEQGGTLVLRIMPDDNSCLFRAVSSAAFSGIDTMTELRSMVAQTIQLNPDLYTKVVLDNKEPDAYCRWIQTQDAWGGQIELNILSETLGVEICSIDVQSQRVDRYNEGAASRCILVYSGIHYDTIALRPFDTDGDEDQQQFQQPQSDIILQQAVALCGKLKERHYYTDTGRMVIKCGDCGAMCVGEAGATEHAKKTNHYNFGEA